MLEWWTATILVALGCWTVLFPRAFSDGRFAPITDVIRDAPLTLLLLVVGGARAVSLFYNGNWPTYGPIIRVIGALGGGAIFFQMGLALWLNHYDTGGQPSPGVIVYFVLTGAEAFSAYRAASDARPRA